jgi:hypothetical protein
VSVFLRNAHPKQTVYLPLAPGWCRVLRPAVTTCVPERLLNTPAVRQLLLRKLIETVDGAAWDAEVRQRRASRTDMTRAIAAAEQAEFDRLLRHRQDQVETRSWTRWTVELDARLLAASAADLTALAAELGITRRSLVDRRAALRRSGPRQPHQRRRRADEWPAEQVTRLRQGIAAGQSHDAVAVALGRTPGAVKAQASRLGLARTAKRWTPGRFALLEQRWAAGVRADRIAAELGVSPAAVMNKARALGLPSRRVEHRRLSAAAGVL